MDRSELVRRHPLLFHTGVAGSWPSIREHGLLTTEQIVRTGAFEPAVAEALLRNRRPHGTVLDHPRLGRVGIRDQSSLRLRHLEPALQGMSVAEWLGVLNGRVFFWLHPAKLQRLLTARRARDAEQDVLVVRTASLVEAHGDRIRLSPINSGATLWPGAPARGPGTFSTIADYPWAERRKGRSAADAIAELAVPGGVPDIRAHVVRVERWRGRAHLFDLPL